MQKSVALPRAVFLRTDTIFVISFTQAICLTSKILPEENAWIATISVPSYDDLSFLSLKWESRMKFLLLLAHLTLCYWFTWLNITKNQHNTHIHVPKTHSQSEILPECWWFYTSAACDACDKYHVCSRSQSISLRGYQNLWKVVQSNVSFV